MENISLSIINLRVNKETALTSNQTFLNKSPSFQRSYEAWDDKLKTRLIETILLKRAMNPIWTVLNDVDESEEILDGMHRLTTALSFLNNEFCLNKQYFTTLNSDLYNKKYFKDMSCDDKAAIRNYNFIFNKLDSTYKNDKNKLRDMYEILNRSSKTLNDWEFNKVLLQPFYDIINEKKDDFLNNYVLKRIKDERGALETEIIELLVLSDEIKTNSWPSITTLKDNWILEHLGDSDESIKKYTSENKKNIAEKLDFLNKITCMFAKEELFSGDKKTQKKYHLPYKFIIARCCYFFLKKNPLFNRHTSNLVKHFKEQITKIDIQLKLDAKSRNAMFQRNLISLIDKIINEEIENSDPRNFSKKIISDTMKKQNNTCEQCKKIIKDNEDYHAHHIKSWTSGGQSNIENCRILHKRCHELLHANN